MRQRDEKQFALINKARKRFNYKFFENHARSGANSSKRSQLELEKAFEQLDKEEKELFILSMLNSAYELNDIIPNIELVFYNMFTSPISTKL